MTSVTVQKEQEDARQAALLKGTTVKSEGDTTQPGTSEEGVVSKKSNETSSDISEVKNVEQESGAGVDKPEAEDTKEARKVDISEKDTTPDPSLPETSADANKISEKLDDLKSDSESKNSSESSVKTSSAPLTGDKVLESSSTKEQAEGTSEVEDLPTKKSSSDTSLVSVSSSTEIPKGPTTTPSESHSDTINRQESSSDSKPMTTQSEPADGKTLVSSDSDMSDNKPKTSQTEPADSKASVSGLSDKESGGAVAIVISGSSVEEKTGGLANESTKLTQEQLDSLFVKETQENLLGLIGAMLPKDSKVG